MGEARHCALGINTPLLKALDLKAEKQKMTCSTLKETKIYIYYTKFKKKHAKTHIKEKKQI